MCNWCVIDTLTDDVIGIWIDFNHAEEFLLDNMADADEWAVMPSMDCFVPLFTWSLLPLFE